MSAFITKELVERAVEIISPSVEQLIKDSKRVTVCIAVLDCDGDDVWEGVIGEEDPTKWGEGKTYDENAYAKALAAQRTRLPNHMMLRRAPQMIEKGDFKYYGGEYRNGIAVGASGLAEHQDYMVSAMLAAVIEALCMDAFEKALADKKSNFL